MPLVPGSLTYSKFGGGAWVWVGVAVTLDFSISDDDGDDDCVNPRLPEKASVNIRGGRDLDGVTTCTRFGVERVGEGGRLTGDSVRMGGGLVGTYPERERLKACGREVGAGGGDGRAGRTVVFP